MSKSTPINQISSLPSNGDDGIKMPIVQDILNEIQQNESLKTLETPVMTQDGRSELNVPSVNYQMDPNIQPLPNQGFQSMTMPNMMQYQQQLLSPPKSSESTLDIILRESKLPLLVGLVYLVMASPKVVNLISKNIAFAATDGVINTSGYLVLAVLTGVVFYLSKMFMTKLAN